MDFTEWMRARLRLAGEEIIRRADGLTLGGLDNMVSMDVSIHIPTMSDEVCWPSLNISFDFGEKKYTDALTNGELPTDISRNVE